MGQIYTVHMPDIGEGVVEGEVISWLKQVGEDLKQDEPVVVVMTDKATVELPSPQPGKLAKQYYKVGEIAVKDHPLYDIALDKQIDVKEKSLSEKTSKSNDLSKSQDIALDKPTAVKDRLLSDNETSTSKVLSKPPENKTRFKTLASPVVRKLAKEMDLDINGIQGTGVDGRVTVEDLQTNAGKEVSEAEMSHLQEDEEIPLVGIHKLMAKKMALSKKNIPHFSFFDRADATRLLDFYQKLKLKAVEKNIKLTLMPFFIKALSQCIKEHPLLNSALDEAKNTIVAHKQQNIGIAMTTSLGLIVPVLKNVHKLSLYDVIFAYDELKKKAKLNQLSSQDMQEGTITITNFGALGDSGVFATPIINYPEAAILGVAHIHSEAIAINDEVKVRSILNCSWSFDHRIIDGDEASKISFSFRKLIENPSSLLN